MTRGGVKEYAEDDTGVLSTGQPEGEGAYAGGVHAGDGVPPLEARAQ